MKQSSNPRPPKKTFLGRISSGLKSWLGKPATAAPGSPTRPARTKKDLFPDEPHHEEDRKSPRTAAKQARARETSPPPPPHPARTKTDRPPESRASSRAQTSPADRPAREPRPSHATARTQPARGERRERPGRPDRTGPGNARAGRARSSPRERESEPSREPRPVRSAAAPPPPGPMPEGPWPPAFEALGLSPRILAAVRDMGYTTPTTIQEKGIPLALEKRDLIGASQTGTGKTAAFGLPILSMMGEPQNSPRLLVLEPTRELASQVVDAFDKFNTYTGLRTVAIYGGVGYEKQRRALHEGVDVLVATPGRLLDFLGDGTISLATIQYLVLDEVDRMLDMGFLPDVRRIVDQCPDKRQTAFFSATMPAQIKTLANWALKEPAEVEVGIRFSPAETVSHYFYPVAADQRESLLLALLDKTDWHSIMIFTRTKMQADRIYGVLSTRTDHKVAVMHSDIAQRDREKALAGFRDGTYEAIVATDLAARGLDISGVSHVINYQVPENPEDYVHRIGRTGRAQKEGDAFTLLSADELEAAESIERLIGQKIERRQLEGFEYEYTALLDPQASSAEKFKKLYRNAKSGGKKRR